METRFGKWIKTKGFARLFVLVLLGAACYMGLRAGNAADWLWGRRLYGPIFLLVLLLMLLAAYAQHTGVRGRFQRCCKRISAYFLCFLLYDVLALLVFDLAGLLLRLGPAVRGWLVVAAAAISALLLLWGSAHARRLKTVRYAVELGMEPGTRLVLLSDLHIGIFIGAGYLERVAAAVNRLEPELVVISGDLFDGYLPADDDQLGRAAGALRKIRAPGGIYAVVGNHDPAVTDQRFHRFLKEAGIQLLHNEAVELENMNLVGRAGIVDSRDGRVPLGRLLQETEPRKRTVVLDHDPQGIREAVSYGADLVLCGHTHKGQFFPMTILTRLANGRDYFYGERSFGKTHAIISAGTGFFQLSIRIGTDSEIVVVDLQ